MYKNNLKFLLITSSILLVSIFYLSNFNNRKVAIKAEEEIPDLSPKYCVIGPCKDSNCSLPDNKEDLYNESTKKYEIPVSLKCKSESGAIGSPSKEYCIEKAKEAVGRKYMWMNCRPLLNINLTEEVCTKPCSNYDAEVIKKIKKDLDSKLAIIKNQIEFKNNLIKSLKEKGGQCNLGKFNDFQGCGFDNLTTRSSTDPSTITVCQKIKDLVNRIDTTSNPLTYASLESDLFNNVFNAFANPSCCPSCITRMFDFLNYVRNSSRANLSCDRMGPNFLDQETKKCLATEGVVDDNKRIKDLEDEIEVLEGQLAATQNQLKLINEYLNNTTAANCPNLDDIIKDYELSQYCTENKHVLTDHQKDLDDLPTDEVNLKNNDCRYYITRTESVGLGDRIVIAGACKDVLKYNITQQQKDNLNKFEKDINDYADKCSGTEYLNSSDESLINSIKDKISKYRENAGKAKEINDRCGTSYNYQCS